MFRLKSGTDPRWAYLAGSDLGEILSDHAYCEQKAASTAISLIIQFPDYPEIVQHMAELAQEEMEHFARVHAWIIKKGLVLGHERKDAYVNEIAGFITKNSDRKIYLVDKLLFAALIEARSCERFKVLSEHIPDPELSEFYRELMESEARHYTLFITLARNVLSREYVDSRWHEFLEHEKNVIGSYGHSSAIHG